MISRYLRAKNIINQVKPTVNDEELLEDERSGFYNLNLYNQGLECYFYRNLFSNYEIDKIISLCKKLPNKIATVSNNKVLEDYRKSSISWLNINNETNWIYEKMSFCIQEANNSVFQYDLTRVEKFQFTKYYGNETGFYAPHIDTSYGLMVDTRKLTFVLQLSDPSEYTGGELRLHTNKDPTCIEKEKGLITFFPSHTLHECTPVTSGVRYTLVGWVHGPKFK